MVLFFQRGAFTASDASTAAALFGLLVLNGPAVAVGASLGRAFYAVQETRIPVFLDVVGNVMVLVFVPVLVARFGGPGAVFAYMLVPWITACGLITLFKRRFGSFPVMQLCAFAGLLFLVAAFAAWLGGGIGESAGRLFKNRFLVTAVTVSVGGAVAAAVYYSATLLFRLPEAAGCSKFLRRVLHLPFGPELSNASTGPVLSAEVGTLE
jgi:putative peptidoglycan lipid II flippase